MNTFKGYYDGECVQLFDKGNLKKNQKVTVTIDNDSDEKNNVVTDADRKLMFEALMTDKFVSSVPTNYDVDAFIRESRGYE